MAKYRKLGRTSSQRKALLRNQVTMLLNNGRIITTEAKAKEVLANFVKTYRDPSYKIPASRSLLDEIWFQRRVELWGECFYTADARRLGKNIVRFHGAGTTNFPDAFAFNVKNDDGWLNLRFPQTEMDTNKGIVDNTEGSQPVAGQNPTLLDGVTD